MKNCSIQEFKNRIYQGLHLVKSVRAGMENGMHYQAIEKHLLGTLKIKVNVWIIIQFKIYLKKQFTGIII